MTRLEIHKEGRGGVLDWFDVEVDPEDDLRCLIILREWVEENPKHTWGNACYISAFHPRKGWIDHRPGR